MLKIKLLGTLTGSGRNTKNNGSLIMKKSYLKPAIAMSLIFTISVFSDDLIPNIKPIKSNEIKSVMFVGHSFFYYNNSLHNHLGKLIKADPEIGDIKRRSITINGSSLSWHNVESYLNNQDIGSFKIDANKDNSYIQYDETNVDAVIMADCSLCPIHPKTKEAFYSYVAKHSKTIRENKAEPILFMTWGYKNKPTMYKKLKKEFLRAANLNNLLVVPAGEAFDLGNKSHPEINLYTSDNRHPSEEGTYLAASVVFATLFGHRTEGNIGVGNIDPSVAIKLQRIADKTVSEFFNLQLK